MAELCEARVFFVLSLLPWLAVTLQPANNCWPRRMYGLPKAGAGCPGSCSSEFVWREGYRLFTANYDSGETPNLSGIFLQNETLLQFCMKNSTYQCLDCPTSEWPDGSYCIYRHQEDGKECPNGFMQGSVTFNGTLNNRDGGILPAGEYTNSSTRLEFCCKEGSIGRSVDIVLPNNRDFYLMAAKNGACQSVQGMNVLEETLVWSGVSVNVSGSVPKGLENNSLELAFCYYRPLSSATINPATDVDNESVRGYIAGMSALIGVLVTLVVILVFGIGLCYIAIKRRRQADIMTDRLNELQQLIQYPHTAVDAFAVAPNLPGPDDVDAQDVQKAPDRFSYPFFKAHSQTRCQSRSLKRPQVQSVSSDSHHFYENVGHVSCHTVLQITEESDEEEEEEEGSLPEDILTASDDDVYEVPLSTERELIHQMREIIITCDNLSDPEPLGSGRFGNVLKATWSSETGSVDVAVKRLHEGASQEERIKFLQEAVIMKQFNHPNVVEIKGVAIDCVLDSQSKETVIVMELMSKGDLQKYLHKMKTVLNKMTYREVSDILLRFAREIASGMEYLSKKKFVHRDLAARNILLDRNYVCKISDFGLARDMEDSQYYSAAGGLIPLKWTAPEALGYRKYSTASDVWSYGCVLYEMWSLGQKPLSHWTIEEFYNNLLEGYRQSPPPGCPRSIYKLMMDCWHPKPRERPTFSAISYTLRQPSDYLLQWPDTGSTAHGTQDLLLGAESAAGQDKHLSLQRMYLVQ